MWKETGVISVDLALSVFLLMLLKDATHVSVQALQQTVVVLPTYIKATSHYKLIHNMVSHYLTGKWFLITQPGVFIFSFLIQ